MIEPPDDGSLRRHPNPIVGAHPFEEADAPRFFGRTNELSDLTGKIATMRITALVAETAAGKSSLIQAGLLPVLRTWRLADRVGAACGRTAGVPSAAVPIVIRDWATVGADPGVGYASPAIEQMLSSLELERSAAVRWGAVPTATAADELIPAPGLEGLSEKKLRKGVIDAAAAEIEAVDRASKGLRGILRKLRRTDSRTDAESYVAAVRTLCTELGAVLIVLDQFEEILRSEKQSGSANSVLIGVQNAYHAMSAASGFGQLISMRNDFSNLLAPLENVGLLSRRRFVELRPLTIDAMFDAVLSMVHGHGVNVSRGFLTHLLAALSDTPMAASKGERPVQLLPSSALLAALCEFRASNIDPASFDALGYVDATDIPLTSMDIESAQGPDSVARLRSAVLRRRLVDALKPDASQPAERQTARHVWRETLVSPIFANMAELLYSAAETKRPVSETRLMDAARGFALADREDSKQAFLPSGRAQLQKLKIEQDGVAGDEAARMLQMWLVETIEAQAREVLSRLHRKDVLKPTAGGEGDRAWELVHDGFAVPVRDWAQAYKVDPEYYVRWIVAPEAAVIDFPAGTGWQEVLPRSGRSHGELPPRRRFEGILWQNCVIRNADFTGVDLRACDFSLSTLKDCTFSDAFLKDCRFVASTFEGCSFADTVIEDTAMEDGKVIHDCTFSGVTWRGGSLIRMPFLGLPGQLLRMSSVAFEGVRIDTCLIARGHLEDVRFGRDRRRGPLKGRVRLGSGLRLPSLADDALAGQYADIGRKALDLNTCVVAGEQGLSFVGCELGASRFENLSVEGNTPGLRFENTRLRWGIILQVQRASAASRGGMAAPSCLEATHCDFSGMVVRSCDMRGAKFVGVDLQRATMRWCDLREATFGPASTRTSLKKVYVSAEHLVIRGCLCDNTVFRHYVLERAIITRCEGGLLTLSDCTLECAGLYRLREADEESLGSVPWLQSRRDAPNHFHIDAKSSDVYHWHWGSRQEMEDAGEWIEPPFHDGEDYYRWDPTGAKHQWVRLAQEIRWGMGGWHQVRPDTPLPRPADHAV